MGISRAKTAVVAGAAAAMVLAAGGSASATSGGGPVVIGHGQHAGGHAKFSVRNFNMPVRGYSATRARHAALAGATVPLWSSSIATGGKTYKFQMVGKNPFIKESAPSVTIKAPIVPVVFTFASGNAGGVFDPTKNPCGESLSDINMVKQSPIFTNLTYTDGGTKLGTGEYVDIFQRANFWKYVGGSAKTNPNYAVNLTGTVEPAVHINVGAGAGEVQGSGCGATGLVNLSTWDSYLQKTLIPSLSAISPTTIPVFIFRNVAMFEGTLSNCCALGYHSGYTNSSGTPQFYTVTDIDDSGNFSGVEDVSDLAHEVGEWMDDPSGANPTPKWGHVGQVPNSCQANLEVGDPLTNTNLPITAANGLTYHPQELTFFSWFYRQKPSIGVNGYYSLADTFKAPSAPCS